MALQFSYISAVTAARQRYLTALGFTKVEDLPNVTPAPNPAERHPSSPRKKITTPQPHIKWRSVDGEWERESAGEVVSIRRNSNRTTLAASVTTAQNKPTLDASALDEVWQRYKETGREQERDELIVFYSPLVKYVASRVAAGLPQSVDQADLVSYGMFGLIDAIKKFDLERGYKFETYAISRIKGAVLDELRSIDWVPRSVRSKAKMIERALVKLEAKNHRVPSDQEIADELGLSSKQLNNMYKQISSLGLVALDGVLSGNGAESLTFGDTLADRSDGPGGVYERQETRQMLAEAINTMNEREKIVLTLYYYENLTLAEIGNVLGVTESRVCQIHTKAVLQLRSRLTTAERI